MPFGVAIGGTVVLDPVANPIEVERGDLFARAWRVVLGVPGQPFAWDISQLDIEFRATRDLKGDPNTVELKVYNLGPQLRAAFESARKNQLLLQAGYVGTGVASIFQGEVRSATSIKDGTNWVTTVRAGDGEKNIKVRIALTFGPQISFGDAIRVISKKMGLKPGNTETTLKHLQLRGVAELFPSGGAVVGNSWRELQKVARSAGLEVSIQDGAIQLLDLHQPLQDLAVLVDDTSGLVGSPEVNADGRVTITTLLIPELRPGVKVDLRAKHIKGGYRVDECEYTGQARGQEWYVRSTLRRY